MRQFLTFLAMLLVPFASRNAAADGPDPKCDVYITALQGEVTTAKARAGKIDEQLREALIRIRDLELDIKAAVAEQVAIKRENDELREQRDRWFGISSDLIEAVTRPKPCEKGCKAAGLCTYTAAGECLAVRNADCTSALVCKAAKKCRAINGICAE